MHVHQSPDSQTPSFAHGFKDRRCPKCGRWPDKPYDSEVSRFFAGTSYDLVTKRLELPNYDLPQVNPAIATCFPDWELVAEGGDRDEDSGALWTVETARVLVAPGRWAECPAEATRFYELPDGRRRVLSVTNGRYEKFRLFIVGQRSEDERLQAELEALSRRIERPHYLQGHVIKPIGEILADFEPRTWDDVALEPDARVAILVNTVEVFRRREAFRANGVPLKRGIILHGLPGTGKTLVGNVLAGLKLATFVYVTAADMSGLESVRSIFDLARRLSPTILFFEDIDLFADDRSSYCSSAMLGEILAQLDGFETNDGLIFIATTNDLAAIDPAIRERPSRFDVVIHLDLPSRDARRQILTQHLLCPLTNDTLLDEAAYATDGLSGDQVREVAYLALQHAILRTTDAEGHVRLAEEDLSVAINRVSAKKDTRCGFHTGAQGAI
jgi:hypothetical protein